MYVVRSLVNNLGLIAFVVFLIVANTNQFTNMGNKYHFLVVEVHD